MHSFDVLVYRNPDKKRALDDAWADLSSALLPEGGQSLTLVSKVMMGVWGCVPSFDTFFRRTFKALGETAAEHRAFNRVGVDALRYLSDVYDQHTEEVETLRRRFMTWDTSTGQPTRRPMTRAKVLDVYGFQASSVSR